MKKLFLTYLDVVLKFFGLQRIIGESEVITYNGEEIQFVTEKELIDPKLERFNEILEYCDKTHGPTGPKWDVDKNKPMFIEPDIIDEHNLDPNRSSKKDYKTLIDDEHRESLWKLKKQDPLYVNGITRRKARTKIVGENTNIRTNRKNKGHDSLDLTTNNPEDSTFKSLMVEIMKNSIED